MLSGVVFILGSSWLINSSGRWNVIDLGIGILRHDLQGMAQSIYYVRSVRSSNYVSFCNEVSFWLTPSEPESLWHGELYAWRRQGVRGSCLYHGQRQSSGGHVHTGLFVRFFETVFFVVLKCQFEGKRVLFLHIFFASFARILWQLAGPDFALLALLLDTYGEEVEFRCARPRQSWGAVGICKIYGHAVGVSIWSGLPDWACLATHLTQLGSCPLCEPTLQTETCFGFRCYLSFGFWVWEWDALELS